MAPSHKHVVKKTSEEQNMVLALHSLTPDIKYASQKQKSFTECCTTHCVIVVHTFKHFTARRSCLS